MESETRKTKSKDTALAEVVQVDDPTKLQRFQHKQEWEDKANKRRQDGRRYPVKVKAASPDTPNTLNVDCDDTKETHCRLLETTGFTDIDAAACLITQVSNTHHGGSKADLTNAALAMMDGIAPESPLEGLLAAQMTVAHNMAMEFSHRAMKEGQTAEGVDRNINRVTKMMRMFTTQAEALQKLRNKGQQKITVQHVQVNDGGQAVIGDVHNGGRE